MTMINVFTKICLQKLSKKLNKIYQLLARIPYNSHSAIYQNIISVNLRKTVIVGFFSKSTERTALAP